MKTGLVVEGGGVRGIYAAGVLDVFLEYGIHFDGVIGNSAGVIHGCSYLSGQKGRSIRYYKKYSSDYRFMSFKSWLKSGNLVDTDFAYHELPEKLDVYDNEAFLRCGVPFYAAVTNVETGEPEYLRITDVNKQIDKVRASASLPYFSQIVELDGKKYLDGGCSDSIPVDAFRSMGYGRNVLVLTQPASYRKKPEFSAVAGIVYRRYPRFADALRNRHMHYNRTAERVLELEKLEEVFVIRPDRKLPIGRMENDPKIVESVYNQGREDALKKLEKLKKWLCTGKEAE